MGESRIGMGRSSGAWRVGARARLSPHGRRAGLTLIELLAAMVVLLVGVYSVAALFPKLSRNIGEDKTRTTMGRATQRVAEAYQSGTYEAPDATAPFDVDVDQIDPSSRPADPDSNSFAENPLNSRDDIVNVYGEHVTVPAPLAAGGTACYVLKQGMVDPGTVPVVSEQVALPQAYRDPGPGGSLSRGCYYLRPTGEMIYRTSGSAAGVLVHYDWFDPALGMVKRVAGELIQASGTTVQAVAARGGTVVPGTTKAYTLYLWACTTAKPAVVAGRRCWVDNLTATSPDAGQSLYFPSYLSGRRVSVSYRVRREDLLDGTNPRRAKIMHEDSVLPTEPPYRMTLNYGGLEDANPLTSEDFSGNTIPDIWLMMVDLIDGTTWVWDDTSDGTGMIEDVDFSNGIVTINGAAVQGTAAARKMGHPVRIYYRTFDENCIQIQKAASEFVEVQAGGSSNVPNWEHRQYSIGTRAGATNTYTYLYGFPAYLEDQAVQVDYRVTSGSTVRQVANELHVITDLDDASLGYGFMLAQPQVSGVGSVRGASMRVVGWWRTYTGRIGRVDVTSMLFPGA